MCEGYDSLLSVCYHASCYIPRFSFASPIDSVIRFLMAFQTRFVWISPKTLCSPVLASFADSKLLDVSRLAIAWLYIQIEHCVSCAIYGMYVLVTLGACAVGTVTIIVDGGYYEGSWLDVHVGTAMSVEFSSTHQGCCFCEPLNLEQHCCAIILASPQPSWIPFPFSMCNIESG